MSLKGFINKQTPKQENNFQAAISNVYTKYCLQINSDEVDLHTGGERLFISSPPGQNDRHFADDIFRCIFVNEKICILITITPIFVPKGLIDNDRALV